MRKELSTEAHGFQKFMAGGTTMAKGYRTKRPCLLTCAYMDATDKSTSPLNDEKYGYKDWRKHWAGS